MAHTQVTTLRRDQALHQTAWGRSLQDATIEARKHNVTYEQLHSLSFLGACGCFMSKREIKLIPEPFRVEDSLPVAFACDPGGATSIQNRLTTALSAGGDGSGDYEVVTPAVPGGWWGGGGTPATTTTHTLTIVQARPLIKAAELVAAVIANGGRAAAIPRSCPASSSRWRMGRSM